MTTLSQLRLAAAGTGPAADAARVEYHERLYARDDGPWFDLGEPYEHECPPGDVEGPDGSRLCAAFRTLAADGRISAADREILSRILGVP